MSDIEFTAAKSKLMRGSQPYRGKNLRAMVIDIAAELENIQNLEVSRVRPTGDDHSMIEAECIVPKEMAIQEAIEAIGDVVKTRIAFDAYASNVTLHTDSHSVIDFVTVWLAGTRQYVTGRIVITPRVGG